MILYLLKNDQTGEIIRNRAYSRKGNLRQAAWVRIFAWNADQRGINLPHREDFGWVNGIGADHWENWRRSEGYKKYQEAYNEYSRRSMQLRNELLTQPLEEIIPYDWRVIEIDTDQL